MATLRNEKALTKKIEEIVTTLQRRPLNGYQRHKLEGALVGLAWARGGRFEDPIREATR